MSMFVMNRTERMKPLPVYMKKMSLKRPVKLNYLKKPRLRRFNPQKMILERQNCLLSIIQDSQNRSWLILLH